VKKTPANGTISMIYGGRRRVTDHQLRVRHRDVEQLEFKHRQAIRSYSSGPSTRTTGKLGLPEQVDFQPLPAKVTAQSLAQISRSSSPVKAIGGTAGDLPGAPRQGDAPGPRGRRIVDALRSSEEQLWRWTARWPSSFLWPPRLRHHGARHQGYPAIIVNGWSFLTGSSWTYGSSYGATVHTHGVATHGFVLRAWPLILGTIQTSAVAVVIALPISIGAASP